MTFAPASVQELREMAGTTLGPAPWLEVTQSLVDAFAEVTGDKQWIHVDTVRAVASPLGGTIAHGLLTLSLGPHFTAQLLSFEGFAQALNYGYDRVRYPAPLHVGKRVRMSLTIGALEETRGGARMVFTQTFEIEGGDRPVCVAEALVHLPAA